MILVTLQNGWGGIRKYLTLVHAFGGCNTTPAVHRKGKLSILKNVEKFKASRRNADVLLQKDRTQETIFATRIRVFVILYCGKDLDSLTDPRFLKNISMIPSSRTVKLRVYFQFNELLRFMRTGYISNVKVEHSQ